VLSIEGSELRRIVGWEATSCRILRIVEPESQVKGIGRFECYIWVESENLIPTPFLAVLAFWLVIIFASFSLFSPLNVTVITFLFLFALSAACAIFLILQLSRPFTGLMMISSAPLRNALVPL